MVQSGGQFVPPMARTDPEIRMHHLSFACQLYIWNVLLPRLKKLDKNFLSGMALLQKKNPDGTNMRLVPPFSTILSSGNRQKYSSLITRQSALNARLGTCTTWEISTNFLLDKPEPKTGLSFRQLILTLPSQVFLGTPLFHSIDKKWRSENEVDFSFLSRKQI